MTKPFRVSWKLPTLLKEAQVDLLELEAALGSKVPDLHAWAEACPETLGADALGWLLWGLGKVTGREYALADLLDFEILIVGA
jgi:hypothetical protein